MTSVYRIPYHPDVALRWAVEEDGHAIAHFSERFEALRHAVNKAASEGGGASISVEGADGVWRPFGSDAKRPMRGSNLPNHRFSVVH